MNGATLLASLALNDYAVSIHAPVKGATRCGASGGASCGVSIHAPVKGATGCGGGDESGGSGFNPRAREGRDLGDGLYLRSLASFNPRAREGRDQQWIAIGQAMGVSIHAPVKGAT